MRCAILIACLCLLVSSPIDAAPPSGKDGPKTLGEKIQGKWARRNHPYSFLIQGNKWTEFREDKVGKPNSTGLIEFPPGKDHAVVTSDLGYVFWLFPAGDSALAVETFTKKGTIWEDGRVFYRPDSAP